MSEAYFDLLWWIKASELVGSDLFCDSGEVLGGDSLSGWVKWIPGELVAVNGWTLREFEGEAFSDYLFPIPIGHFD